MNSPREVASVMRKANHRDVIVYLTQFSQVHSSYGAQLDATGKNTTGLTKFKRSLDLCELLVMLLVVYLMFINCSYNNDM